ncbi:MAG: tetratricopeptide repeat protein [Opitutales bacterium]
MWAIIGLTLLGFQVAAAGPAEEAEAAYGKGDYATAVTKATEAIKLTAWKEDLHVLHIRALMAQGKYKEALAVTEEALKKVNRGVRVRLAAEEVFHYNGDSKRAAAALQEINQLAGARTWAYRNAPDLVALGRTALKLGGDPKLVLDNLYKAARAEDADYLGIPLAIGELALSKHDFELAGRTFQIALKKHPENAELHYGTARAFASSDLKAMLEHLATALELNPNHAPSLLLLANSLIDREAYADAEEQLAQVIKANPHHAEAWAYRSIIAHLMEKKKAEKEAREKALAHWKNNPRIDYLIGRKLSQRYRFVEGAQHQRQALALKPDFQPARVQLAQDLLRLGEEEEGWKLAAAAREADGYDVATFNLLTLKDTLDKYATIKNERFILRMAPHEAAIYGSRAMRLLERAHQNLTEKYGLTLEKPTIVEIFDRQKDFGVRTFGMPENPGYLGVCFGCLITANSPATQMPGPANWEAVLWHEFCHTVTLAMTKNKMPRWLSEGISVFEEREANPTWGQRISPRYRAMILEGELTPVSKLSGAFMAPKSPMHLQFAYYQSSLVVEHIVERFGHEAIVAILEKLRNGTAINAALAEVVEPIEELDAAFEAYAVKRAESLGPELDWEKPRPDELRGDLPEQAEGETPNFYRLSHKAKQLVKQRKWEEAKPFCEKLIRLCPDRIDGEANPYALLASCHREMKEFTQEREVLEILAWISNDAYDVYLRLIELGEEAEDWEAVRANAERALAVNPLLPRPYRHLALVAETQDQAHSAIESWETLLQLEPEDPAEAHFRLAHLFKENKKDKAKRHLLMALEEAPRFRQAHRLLLDWKNENEK